MKRILYFVPAILALLIYLLLAFKTGFGSINPFAWICISLMFAAAIVMSNGKWYGCMGGVIVGIILIYQKNPRIPQPSVSWG